MIHFKAILFKELGTYFTTPVAYVFSAIFLFLINVLTFTIGGFFERGEADLSASFFQWHPILFALFAPAIGMRIWADEHRQGTLDLLFSRAISLSSITLAKYVASVIFIAVPLALTSSVVITTSWLGDPEYSVILSGYFGSLLTAASFVAIACVCSALCRAQITAFVIGVAICMTLVLMGLPQLSKEIIASFPGSRFLVEAISSFGVNQHFGVFRKGVIEIHSLVYFCALISACLFLNYYIILRRQS